MRGGGAWTSSSCRTVTRCRPRRGRCAGYTSRRRPSPRTSWCGGWCSTSRSRSMARSGPRASLPRRRRTAQFALLGEQGGFGPLRPGLARTFGLPIMISHCSNNYGPYQMPEKLIPVIILAALEGGPFPFTAMERTYVTGSSSKTKHAPGADCARGRARTNLQRRGGRGDDERRHGAGNLRHEMGWRPTFNLHEGLGRTVRWYLENRWWWQRIRDGGFKGRRRQGRSAPRQPARGSESSAYGESAGT